MAHEERDFIEHPERLAGFSVRATDGRLGTVVDATQHGLLVRTGRLRRRRLAVPARAVESVDVSRREVLLDRTRRQTRRFPQPTGVGRAKLGGWFFPGAARDAGPNVPYAAPGPPAAGDRDADA